MNSPAAAVFEGQEHLRLRDMVDFRPWRGLLIFVVLTPVLSVLAMSERQPYEGRFSHYFMAGLAVICAAIVALGLVVLYRKTKSALRLVKASVGIRIYADRIAWIERSETAPAKTVEEKFEEYSGCSEEPRGLFLFAKVQVAGGASAQRVSLISRACFRENWEAVREYVLGKIPSANGGQ